MSKTFTIELPVEMVVEFRKEIGTKTVKLEDKTPEWFLSNLDNGLRQRVADAISGKANSPEGLKAIRDKYENLCVKGEVPAGGGGGGTRQSVEERGWLKYFAAIGHKEGGKPVNGKTLERAQAWAYRQAMFEKLDAGTPERADFEKNTGKYWTETGPAWTKGEEANEEGVGGFIALLRMEEKLASMMKG